MPEKHQEDNDRDRYAEQPEKNRHSLFLHVLVINSAIENSFLVTPPVRLSRYRLGTPLTVFCDRIQCGIDPAARHSRSEDGGLWIYGQRSALRTNPQPNRGDIRPSNLPKTPLMPSPRQNRRRSSLLSWWRLAVRLSCNAGWWFPIARESGRA